LPTLRKPSSQKPLFFLTFLTTACSSRLPFGYSLSALLHKQDFWTTI
jgi:hypothetical protein